MATYKRFEDLPVWGKAADLAATMFTWTSKPVFRGKGDLANQLQRATLSISTVSYTHLTLPTIYSV